ncbi:MAG: myo-inositol 2-dehydrogenase / D-chiro-inositol 1-dehydrogenase [Nocardioidaceae bacterium]|nr:myo-inositol 2-dehydrogenase / D-chiro-inositol 1-dehydrogenase [Nocardioidaceae bacterium]
MSQQLRAGIVGAGLIAGCHARAYAATPGVEVVAVADPRLSKAEQLAGSAGAEPCTDLEQVLDLDVDIVSVCTPPSTHADLAVRAMKAGKHVLCEKPVAASLEDARRVLEAAESTDRVAMIGQVSRFEPDHRVARDLVTAGHVGDVAMVVHSITTSLPGWSEGGWLTRVEESGGPLLDLSVHSFDYLAWVIGSPAVRVHAVAADSPAGPATYTLATVRYANGAMGQVEASWAHPVARGFKAVVEICGKDGRISWDYDGINGGAVYVADGGVTWLDPLGERGFARELGAFVDAVRAGGPSPVPVREGYEATRTALAALHSARTGEPVDLTSWEVA